MRLHVKCKEKCNCFLVSHFYLTCNRCSRDGAETKYYKLSGLSVVYNEMLFNAMFYNTHFSQFLGMCFVRMYFAYDSTHGTLYISMPYFSIACVIGTYLP